MNHANLEILGITVPMGIAKYYDDGFVESILKHTLELNKKYNISDSDYNIKLEEGVKGMCYSSIGINHYAMSHHIFYVKQPIEPGNILVRAHEESHVATHSYKRKGLDVLAKRLLKKQRVKINLKEIDENEVIANLGSLYALHARGIPQWEIELLYTIYGEPGSRTTAKKIYEQSKLPRKKFFLL